MVTAKDIVNDILDGKPATDNPEAALQKIFSILAGKNHLSFWSMLIGICIHLDARYKVARLYAA